VSPGPIVGPGDVVYAASNGGVLHAIDLATGRDRWSLDGGGSYGSDLSTSAALRRDGLLLWPGPHDTLYGIDAVSGSLLWKRGFGGMILSPALGRDRVYVGTMDGRLHALTVTRDGAHVDWSTDLGVQGQQSYGSPAVSSDGTVYETVANRIVAVRDAGDRGSILWHFDIASGTEVSPAVSRDGVAVFGTNDQTEYGLDPQGRVTWRYPRNSLSYSSPAVTPNGIAYFGDHRGFVDAVDTRLGMLVRRYRLSGEVWTAPVVDGAGDVYAGTKTGHITGFRVDGTRLFDIATGGVVDSYPAIAGDGTLLIGSSDGSLYAIGQR
jgi:outer membrane protein assembly factor BamB